jgi:tRNA 2-thiouridine synthesizing protein E
MMNKEETAKKFAESDKLMDVSVDTDIDSQLHTQRVRELKNWNEAKMRSIATEEGVELFPEHLHVISVLQKYYIEHGSAKNGREISDMLDEEFSEQGGRKYLHRLFPQGPVAQGMRFAGLAVPNNSEDEGFGTAR